MCYVLKVLLHWLFLILLHLLSKIFFYVFKCCRSSAVIIVLLVLCLKSAKSALFSPSPYRGINCRDHQGWQGSSLSRPPPSSPSPPPSSPPITTTNHHHHQHHHDGGRARVKPFLPRLVSCRLSFTLPSPTMPPSPFPRETRFCLIMLNLFSPPITTHNANITISKRDKVLFDYTEPFSRQNFVWSCWTCFQTRGAADLHVHRRCMRQCQPVHRALHLRPGHGQPV